MSRPDKCNCAVKIPVAGAFMLACLAVAIVGSLAAYHLWPERPKPATYEQGGAPTDADIPRLCGWAGEESAANAWEALKGHFPKFAIIPKKAQAAPRDKRVVLWDAAKAVLGKNLPVFRQEVGDCVSMGTANACNYLLVVQIATGTGPPQEFHPSYQPFIYGISRVQIGGGSLGGDGSNGVWAARGCQQYGTLPADAPGVPPYSGSVARTWGRRPGPPANFLPVAAKNLVKTTAKITTWQECRDAICNGYPVTVASGQGFRVQRDEAAKKVWGLPSGSWAHQMCFVGFDPEPEPCFYCQNSWGEDAHGAPLGDAPAGGFWVKAPTANRMLAQGDSFAYSEQQGFPAREWNLDLLKSKATAARLKISETSPFQLAP